MIGRLFLCWNGPFAGAIVNFGGCKHALLGTCLFAHMFEANISPAVQNSLTGAFDGGNTSTLHQLIWKLRKTYQNFPYCEDSRCFCLMDLASSRLQNLTFESDNRSTMMSSGTKGVQRRDKILQFQQQLQPGGCSPQSPCRVVPWCSVCCLRYVSLPQSTSRALWGGLSPTKGARLCHVAAWSTSSNMAKKEDLRGIGYMRCRTSRQRWRRWPVWPQCFESVCMISSINSLVYALL